MATGGKRRKSQGSRRKREEIFPSHGISLSLSDLFFYTFIQELIADKRSIDRLCLHIIQWSLLITSKHFGKLLNLTESMKRV